MGERGGREREGVGEREEGREGRRGERDGGGGGGAGLERVL